MYYIYIYIYIILFFVVKSIYKRVVKAHFFSEREAVSSMYVKH